MILTVNQIEFFRQNGYLIVEDLLTADEVRNLLERAEMIAHGELADNTPIVRQVEPAIERGEQTAEDYMLSLRKMTRLGVADPVFQAHACNPRIVDCISSLLNADHIKLYQDQLFMKPPHVGSRQPYHQDQPLGFYIDPPDMVTCWAALDHSTLENGCLRVVPGTHRSGVLPREQWQEYETRAAEGELPEEVPLVMSAGSCSFHHGHLLHSSEVNRSEKQRRGYATHYVAATARYTGPEPRPEFLVVRGQSFEGCI